MTDAPELEHEAAALLARTEAARIAGEILDRRDTEAERDALLQAWIDAGMGTLPLPDGPKAYAALPLAIRLMVETKNPDLARKLAPPVPLPAATEARLKRGLDALTPDDVEPLLQAGYSDVVEKLRQRFHEQVWMTHEANAAAEALVRQQGQAEYDAQVAAGLERFNAQQRAAYAQRVRQGRG